MEGYELGAYDGRSHKTDGHLTPREPLLRESNEEPLIQSDGASSMYLKEPIVSSESLPHEETPQGNLLRQSYAAASQKGWLTEILAFLLAFVALSAIVITLAMHNGTTLPNWPLQISINALVSIFGVILKGTMLVPVAEAISQLKFVWYMNPNPLIHLSRFDLASRGPWGATRLILTLRGQHIACLGAAITILAMASGPFIQQVIKYHPCPQVVPGLQASVLRTNNYTVGNGVIEWLYGDGSLGSAIDPLMQAALYEGVYDSFSGITPTCPTGNCTFPLYRTVGMCSGCNDISDTINKTCSNAADMDTCTWTLPSGLTINNTEGITTKMAPADNTTINMIDITTNMAPADRTNTLSVTNIIMVKENWTENTEQPYVAVQCSLFPCVRTYSMEVLQNQNAEVLLDTSELVQQQTDSFVMALDLISGEIPFTIKKQSEVTIAEYITQGPYIEAPMPCLLDGIYYDASSFTERNKTNVWAAKGLLPNNAIAYLPSSCVFIWGYPRGLHYYLPLFLQGSATTFDIGGDVGDPDWMAQFNRSTQNINACWAAIADSMTLQVRKSGDPSNSAPAIGSAYQTDTCISVQWPWLTFPAALLILTLVFLIATIAQSRKHNSLHIWKGSPLALLSHGMDQDWSDRYRLVDGLAEMEHMAEQTVVQIKDVEGELRFVDAPHG